MNSCSVCEKDLPSDGLSIECEGCRMQMHLQCASLATKTFRSMSEDRRKQWRCATCRAVRASEKDFENLFRNFKVDLEKSQEFLSERYDILLKKLEETNNVVTVLNMKIEDLVGKLQEKDIIIEDLSNKVHNLEQYSRKNMIEINGVKKVEGEHLESIVVNIAKKMSIEIEEADIEVVHRLPPSRGKEPNIIVEFASRKKRNLFINNKNKIVILNKDIGVGEVTDRVYVNESLSPYYKDLLWKTKTAARDKHYKFVWFRFGKLLVKKSESDAVIKINNVKDLDKL